MTDLTSNSDELVTHSGQLAELSTLLDQAVVNVRNSAISDGAYGQLLAGFSGDIRRISQPGIDVLVQSSEIMSDTSEDMHKSALALAAMEDRNSTRFRKPQ